MTKEEMEKDYSRAIELCNSSKHKEAVPILEKLSRHNHADSQCKLGELYGAPTDMGVKRNFTKAVNLLTKAAEQEHKRAQCELGDMYESGDGVQRDPEESIKWFLKAYKNGSDYAKTRLAHCFNIKLKKNRKDTPEVLEAMYDEAKQLLRKNEYTDCIRVLKDLDKQGYEPAQYELGELYEQGWGVKKNYKKAYEYYRKASNQGHIESHYALGCLYSKGWGVERDDIQAIHYWLLAAKHGYQQAKDALYKYNITAVFAPVPLIEQERSDLYWRARALYENNRPEEAYPLYAELVEYGRASAQFDLGQMYAHGSGVEQDDERAIELWTLSAKQGHYYAKMCLESRYGIQVEPDSKPKN